MIGSFWRLKNCKTLLQYNANNKRRNSKFILLSKIFFFSLLSEQYFTDVSTRDLVSKYLNEVPPQPTENPPPEPHPLPTQRRGDSSYSRYFQKPLLESKYFSDSRSHEPAVNEKSLKCSVNEKTARTKLPDPAQIMLSSPRDQLREKENVQEALKMKEKIFHESTEKFFSRSQLLRESIEEQKSVSKPVPEAKTEMLPKPREHSVIDFTEEEPENNRDVDLKLLRSKLLKDCDEMEMTVQQLGHSIKERLSKIRAFEREIKTEISIGSERPELEQNIPSIDALLKEEERDLIPQLQKISPPSKPSKLPEVDALLDEIKLAVSLPPPRSGDQKRISETVIAARDELLDTKLQEERSFVEENSFEEREEESSPTPMLASLKKKATLIEDLKPHFAFEKNEKLNSSSRREISLVNRKLTFENFTRNISKFEAAPVKQTAEQRYSDYLLQKRNSASDFDHLKYSTSLRNETSKALEKFKEALVAIDKNMTK